MITHTDEIRKLYPDPQTQLPEKKEAAQFRFLSLLKKIQINKSFENLEAMLAEEEKKVTYLEMALLKEGERIKSLEIELSHKIRLIDDLTTLTNLQKAELESLHHSTQKTSEKILDLLSKLEKEAILCLS